MPSERVRYANFAPLIDGCRPRLICPVCLRHQAPLRNYGSRICRGCQSELSRPSRRVLEFERPREEPAGDPRIQNQFDRDSYLNFHRCCERLRRREEEFQREMQRDLEVLRETQSLFSPIFAAFRGKRNKNSLEEEFFIRNPPRESYLHRLKNAFLRLLSSLI